MDSTQWMIQLQLNQPQNALSAYLPVGNLFTPNVVPVAPGTLPGVTLPAVSDI